MTTGFRIFHFLFAWLFKLVFLARVKYQINEPPENENIIVCSNHISAQDPIILSACLKRHQPYYMAKKELFKVPVLKRIIKAFGAFPVNREGSNTGTVFHTIKLLKEGKNVGMFPQGTRCKGKNPRETKIRSGVGMIASKAEATILPVFIKVKDHSPRFLRPVKVIIGKPIRFSEFNYNPDKPDEYMRISAIVFDKICELNENEDRIKEEKKQRKKCKIKDE